MIGLPFRIFAFLCLAAGVLQIDALAGIPAIDFSGWDRVRDQDRIVGYEFETQRDITVTHLGKFDANGNGTLDDLTSPRVGLWDQIGQLQTSAYIDPLTTLENGAFYAPVAPTTIPPGIYVVGVQAFDDQEPYLTATSANVATSDAVRPVVVPEPSTFLLGLMALVGVSFFLNIRPTRFGENKRP